LPVRSLRNAATLLVLSPLCAWTQTPASPPKMQTLIVSVPNATPPLTTSDLALTIGGQPQSILRLDKRAVNVPPPQPLNLPPGTLTDVTPLSQDATLNILLLDVLNAPTKSPAYLRTQLRQLTEHADPNAPLAIFGLADHVILLQGFSSPKPLQDAVEHKLIPRASTAPAGDAASPSESLLAANLQQFTSQAASVDVQLRPQRTLDALETLAHYLASLPGHKNLLWVSASFPDGLYPSTQSAKKAGALDAAELYQTLSLLSAAHVSIFPIDAPNLLPASATKEISQPAQHALMSQIADNTGGQAFFDTTDLAATVNAAMQTGPSTYTLTYTPTSAPSPGTTQPIAITTADHALKLAYPRFAYAPPGKPTDAYLSAALVRGTPTPADILFKVRVLPASTAAEDKVAPSNTQNPSYKVPGPWQRYSIDFIALGDQFSLTQQPDGKHGGKVEFFAYAYDLDGRLLNTAGRAIGLNLVSADYERFQTSPVSLHLELSVPLRQESFLRICIRDVTNNRIGVVELPASSVSQLPPAPTPNH
jgi:VWFA-related protein